MATGSNTSASTVSTSVNSSVSSFTASTMGSSSPATIPAAESGAVGSMFSSLNHSFSSSTTGSLSHTLSTKLSSTNFVVWKAQIELVLRANRVLNHVDGSAPPLPDSSEFSAWEVTDLRILSWLFSCVSETLLPQLIGAASTLEAWQRLHSSFAQGSRPQVRNLVYQLRHMKLNFDNITTYVQKAKGLFDHLAMLGSPMSMEDFCDCIKGGLPEEYEFVCRFLNSNPTVVTFDYLYGLLLNEEIQLNQKKGDVVAPTVQYAHRQGSAPRGRGRGRGGHGRGGGSPNTFSPQQDWGRGTPTSDVSNVLCYNCKGRGHYANKCSSPRFPRENPNQNKPMNNFASPSNNQPWVMDTGATHHMTSDLDNLHLHSEYQGPEQVTLGFGNKGNHPQGPE